MLTALRERLWSPADERAQPLGTSADRWETAIYVGTLLMAGIVFCAAFIPYCTGLNWSDSDFTGWDYSIATRISFAHRLYDAGNLTPIPPLSYLIVKLAGWGQPRWTTEMTVIVVCQVLTALVFALGAAKAFGRWPAFVGALAGLGFFAGFSKTIAYDATAQLFAAIVGVAIAAHVTAQRRDDLRRIRTTAIIAGLGAAGAFLCKQSLGVFLVPGIFVAIGVFGSGGRLTRYVPVAVASAIWFVILTLLMAPWVNLPGMFLVGMLGGVETKGGEGHLFPLFLEFFRYGTLTIVLFAIVNAMMQSGSASDSTGDIAREPAELNIPRLALGSGALLLAGLVVALPWTSSDTPGIGYVVGGFQWIGDYAGPILMWAALYLSLRQVLWTRYRRSEHALEASAITMVFIFAAAGMSLSVLSFRWTFDNNPLIMSSIALGIGYVGLFVSRSAAARTAIVAAAAFFFVISGWSSSRLHFFIASHSNLPTPQFPELGGAATRPEDEPWRKVATLVKSSLRPSQTALLLPEDPHTEALFERPRPPLRSGVIFVDTLQSADGDADKAILTQQPPAIIAIGPILAWHTWFHALRTGSPAENLIDWVTKSLIPSRYRLVARYRLPEAQYTPKGDVVKVYALNDMPTLPAAIPASHGELPLWLKLSAGRRAYLKSDGRGAQSATVCDSTDAYNAFAGGGSRRDCATYDQGTLVRIIRTEGALDQDAASTPLVEIESAGGQRLGFVDASLLRPIVATNATLVAEPAGKHAPELWLTREQSGEPWDYLPSPALGLEAGTFVQVLEQHPFDGRADLYVHVLSGSMRDSFGWMSGLSVPPDNVSSDEFALARVSHQ